MNNIFLTKEELMQVKCNASIRILESNRIMRIHKDQNKSKNFIDAIQWEIDVNESILIKCTQSETKYKKINENDYE